MSKSQYRNNEVYVRGVIETCIYVDDLAAAEDFYSRILGLRVVSREKDRHVFFRCGEAMFLVFNPDQTANPDNDVPNHGARGAGHVAFRVPQQEIPLWREYLQNHGVEIEQAVNWPGGGSSLYFRDPAGNSLEIVCPELWGIQQEEKER